MSARALRPWSPTDVDALARLRSLPRCCMVRGGKLDYVQFNENLAPPRRPPHALGLPKKSGTTGGREREAGELSRRAYEEFLRARRGGLRWTRRNRKRPALLTRLVRPLGVEQRHGHVRNEDADRHGKGGCARARRGARGGGAGGSAGGGGGVERGGRRRGAAREAPREDAAAAACLEGAGAAHTAAGTGAPVARARASVRGPGCAPPHTERQHLRRRVPQEREHLRRREWAGNRAECVRGAAGLGR